jgi:hypothetical protein
VAKYWLDPNNQHEYAGHELLNLRGSWGVTPSLTLTLVATNLMDKGYAERADFGFGSYRYFVGSPAASCWVLRWRCNASGTRASRQRGALSPVTPYFAA